jgi:glycerophosphoryl diester phosphodiesterase
MARAGPDDADGIGRAAPLRLAHRGDHRRVHENTLAAFGAALGLPGCDGLEFDVRVSADGIPVVLHDDTLQRVQGRPDRVHDVRADALEALGVPTLEAVMAQVPGWAFLDVELKEDVAPAVVDALRVARGPDFTGVVVSSFDANVLAHAATAAPSLPRWLNADRLGRKTIDLAAGLRCRAISVAWSAIDRHGVDAARAAGLDVAAWTVRRRPTFDRLTRLGVVAACVEGRALDSRD